MKKGLVLSTVSVVFLAVLAAVFLGQSRGMGIGSVIITGPTHLRPGETGTYTATVSSNEPLKMPVIIMISATGIETFTVMSDSLSKTFSLNFGSSTGDKYIAVEAITDDNKFIGYFKLFINVSNETIVQGATIVGPLAGGVNTPQTYTGSGSPSGATPPFKITWTATDLPSTSEETQNLTNLHPITFPTVGIKTVGYEITGLFDDLTIPDPNAPRATMMTNIVQNFEPVTGINLEGPATGEVNVPQQFDAVATGSGGVTPTFAILFQWEESGKTPVQTISQSVASSREFTFLNAGLYEVLVRATNSVLTMDSPFAKKTIEISDTGSPKIVVNRIGLQFAGTRGGVTSSPQSVTVRNGGGGSLNWRADPDRDWIYVSPASGTNWGLIGVSVDMAGMSPGVYNGKVTISASGCLPVDFDVALTVLEEDNPPFGSFDTPLPIGTFYGSVPVTGWALDDIGVVKVIISGQLPGGSEFDIGDVVFIEGARPDVAQAFPDKPNNYRAGWGYMLLTYGLPNGGNGVVTLFARAVDSAGQETLLGSKTITCDNAHAVKPFGAIDTPAQGGSASGTNFINWGWVLTPLPNSIPTDGSTINVWVDGVPLGHPTYNLYRSDIATLFPGYANSNGAVGYFYIDTTKFTSGVHTIAWSAVDNVGNVDGIGSRFFTIANTGSQTPPKSAGASGKSVRPAGGATPLKFLWRPEKTIQSIERSISPLLVAAGYALDRPAQPVFPDGDGQTRVVAHEGERIEIRWSGPGEEVGGRYSAYLLRDGRLDKLPIGSSLDADTGVFSWQLGPGFLGEFEIILVRNEWSSAASRKSVVIRILTQNDEMPLPVRDGFWNKLIHMIPDSWPALSPNGRGR